jgi:hypothetical protein
VKEQYPSEFDAVSLDAFEMNPSSGTTFESRCTVGAYKNVDSPLGRRHSTGARLRLTSLSWQSTHQTDIAAHCGTGNVLVLWLAHDALFGIER